MEPRTTQKVPLNYSIFAVLFLATIGVFLVLFKTRFEILNAILFGFGIFCILDAVILIFVEILIIKFKRKNT